MSTREGILLARHIDVPRALAARRRLLIAWCVLLALLMVLWIFGMRGMLSVTVFNIIVFACLGVYVWAAAEAMSLEHAMCAAPWVCGMTLIAALVPLSAPIVVMTLLLESAPVVSIARRAALNKCAWCEYDLSGLTGSICPECGKAARP